MKRTVSGVVLALSLSCLAAPAPLAASPVTEEAKAPKRFSYELRVSDTLILTGCSKGQVVAVAPLRRSAIEVGKHRIEVFATRFTHAGDEIECSGDVRLLTFHGDKLVSEARAHRLLIRTPKAPSKD